MSFNDILFRGSRTRTGVDLMMPKKIHYLYLGLLLASFSCSENTRTVEDITLTAEVSTLDGRLTTQLSVITTPPGIANPGLVWSSSDPSMATVDNSGLVTAVRKGTVTLTAALQNDPDTKGTLDLDITQNDFVTTWKGKQITIPTNTKFEYDYNVDWDNDGHFDSTSLTGSTDHTFENDGEHTIRISGIFPAIRLIQDAEDPTPAETANAARILFVDQWGSGEWLDLYGAFESCQNLDVRATDAPNLTQVRSVAYMFSGTNLTTPDFSQWDTSTITDMENMFSETSTANPEVDGWNTSNVTDMTFMFFNATAANPEVSNWDTGQVTAMTGMFQGATAAKPSVGEWETAQVTAMDRMFQGATAAGPDVRTWNTAQVINMANMFKDASTANPDLSLWNISSVDPENSSYTNPQHEGLFDIFAGSALSRENYDKALERFAAHITTEGLSLSTNISLGTVPASFCRDEAETARNDLIENKEWSISDGGKNCE